MLRGGRWDRWVLDILGRTEKRAGVRQLVLGRERLLRCSRGPPLGNYSSHSRSHTYFPTSSLLLILAITVTPFRPRSHHPSNYYIQQEKRREKRERRGEPNLSTQWEADVVFNVSCLLVPLSTCAITGLARCYLEKKCVIPFIS